MRIFIIGGKANVGKNYAAKCIKEYYDLKDEKSIITEYSKYIKVYAEEMLAYKSLGQDKPRSFLQALGEEARKLISPNVFIDRMQEDILVYQKYFQNIIICDARLIPEITLMKAKYKNCYTIQIIGKENNLTKEEKEHITETEFDKFKDFDFIIRNENNKIEDLKKDVERIVKTIETNEGKM